MLRTIVFTLFIVSLSFSLKAQKYSQATWIGYSHDSNFSIYQIDDQGNAYAAIGSRDYIDFCGKIYNQHASSDYSVLGKFDSKGRLIWSRTISADNGSDQIYDLKVDQDHNIYVSGWGSNIKLDDGTMLVGGTFLIKYDKNGKTLWGVISNDSQTVGGPIALTSDGVFWGSDFYAVLHLQGKNVTDNDPNNILPNAFVAKVSTDGKVTGIYHDPSLASGIQIVVPSVNGTAAIVTSRGGDFNNVKVLLDGNCNVISENPFLAYGDYPSQLQITLNGYEMITNTYKNPGSAVRQGYFDIHFDKLLNVIDSVKVYPNPATERNTYTAINYNNQGYYCTAPASSSGYNIDWLFTDGKGAVDKIQDENGTSRVYNDVYTRNFVRVIGDTLNMSMRHFDVYGTSYTFGGQNYTTPSNLDESYFWVKYLPEDPDSCKNIKAVVVKNGIEGSQDAVIKLSLPKSCPAQEDITVKLTEDNPALNQNDFILPNTVTIKKGDTTATATIKIIDDNYIELLESFNISLNNTSTTNGYGFALGASHLTFTITDNDNTDANRHYTIAYTPEIKEGNSGKITISLPGQLMLSQPLTLVFNKSTVPYEATPVADYNPIAITLPAGVNKMDFNVDALNDDLIEGDEFIAGNLSATDNALGVFTTGNSLLNIKIIDADNLPENRVIQITPATNLINEGNAVSYTFQLSPPYKLQYPLNITTAQILWYNFLQQSQLKLIMDNTNTVPNFSITYPDDQVIRPDKTIELSLAASDAHIGDFTFKWRNEATDHMDIQVIDNDKSYLQLVLSPLKLVIREGNSDMVKLQLAGGRTLEENLDINYQWAGSGIANDLRILQKVGNIMLPKGDNTLIMPVSIADNKSVDEYNQRTINFDVPVSTVGDVSMSPQKFVDVNIIDDDISTLQIPNLFTPNGDGINDTWSINNLAFDNQSKVQVFNRYGQVIYSSNGYAVPWNGETGGKSVPIGTYYYVIVFYNKTFSGSITVLR